MIQINGVNVDTQQLSEPTAEVSDAAVQLSESARQALRYIPRAKDWLVHMGTDTSETYSFSDEVELIDGVSQGLSGNSLLYLPHADLLVAIRPFMRCSAEDRNRLCQPGQVTADEVPVSARLNWTTQQELQSVQGFLDLYGLQQVPFLSALDLQGKIALFTLSESWKNGSDEQAAVRKTGVAFAARQATRAREFVEYCRAYDLLMAGQMKEENGDDLVTKTIFKLQEGVFTLLRSVVTEEPPRASSVLASVAAFVDQGNRFGFSGLGSGVLQLVRDAGYRVESTSSPEIVAKGHLDKANSFARSRAELDETWAQHGHSAFYAARESGQSLMMRWDAGGGVTLASYSAMSSPS